MGIATTIEQEGPRSVIKDSDGMFVFCCRDCDSVIETDVGSDGQRRAEDLLDTHHCEDVS